MSKFTDVEMLFFMKMTLIEEDQLPTVNTLSIEFNVYPNAIQDRIFKLEKYNLLKRNKFGNIKLSQKAKSISLKDEIVNGELLKAK